MEPDLVDDYPGGLDRVVYVLEGVNVTQHDLEKHGERLHDTF